MPDGRRDRRRAAVLGDGQGQQGKAAAGSRPGGGVLRLRRRRPQVVTLVTRAGCTMCEQTEPVVRRLAQDAGVPLEVRDVDADPADRRAWSDHVPVVLLDGALHARWWVDEAALAAALRGR